MTDQTESSTILRTFVAVELPESVLSAIGGIQRDLASTSAGRVVRWSRVEGIHLTLKFLGDTPSDRVPEIERSLAEAISDSARFALALAPLGAFPDFRAPRVILVGLGGDTAELQRVQRRVEDALSPLGFPTERRAFSPHLTLGRVADVASPAERQALGGLIARARLPRTDPFEVAEVSLIRSDLLPGGARYTRLAAIPLL